MIKRLAEFLIKPCKAIAEILIRVRKSRRSRTNPVDARCRSHVGSPIWKLTLGAQLSEVLNADVDGKEENGFSRRRVVAGVAWSLPVIATAIAAPAAAASASLSTQWVHGAASITFVNSGGTGSGTNRSGTGPTAFRILSAGSATNGAISGTITLTPIGTVDAGIGIQSVAQTAPSSPTYGTSHSYTGSFTSTVNIQSGQSADVPIAFQYENVNPAPKKSTKYSYSLLMTLRLPNGTTQTLTDTVSITF